MGLTQGHLAFALWLWVMTPHSGPCTCRPASYHVIWGS